MSELTPRQRMIERLVRRGMTSRRIAEQLGISQRTVEAHRANISRRLESDHQADPLDHPVVQKALKRLSDLVALLVSEIERLRTEHWSISPDAGRAAHNVSRGAAVRYRGSTRNAAARAGRPGDRQGRGPLDRYQA